MKTVSNLGWYGHKNCGDEMFREVLPEIFPTHQFHFHTTLNPAEINKSDFLLIGGGNIVDPGFLRGLDEVKDPYSFIGVGLTHPEQVPLLQGAEQVFVRDDRSYGFVKGLPNTHLMPDLAFSMTPSPANGRRLLNMWVAPSKRTVGVFLNDCVNTVFNSTLLKFFEAHKVILELARFLDSLPYNILFLPMSFLPPDDRRISLDVIGNMKRGYQAPCLLNPLAAQQQLDLVSVLDYGITMRLHASIFCTIGGVPFIDLTHHSKSRSYLETMGLGQLSIDYYELSIRVLEEKFAALSSRRYTELQDQLLLSADQQKVKFKEMVAHVRLP